MKNAQSILRLLAACIGMLSASAHANVTNVVWYRLGENDPGAAPGATPTNTIDLVASNNLTFSNAAFYSSDIAPSAVTAVHSSLSVNLTNSAYAYHSPVTTVVDNFGIECWVKPAGTSGGQVIAYNGNTATGGWGLLINNSSTYQALYGGKILFGTNAAVPNVWTHLALVRNSGMATFYVNGIATITSPVTPAVPASNFAIGAPPQSPTSEFYTGLIDEVRVFTFAPGQFSTNDLLLNRKPTVTTLSDDNAPGSLRVVLANAYPGDTIGFATNGTIALTNGALVITNNLTILGPGPTNLILTASNLSRVFNISADTTNFISGLTISDGSATSDLNGSGGGIYNAGSLTLSNCVIAHNRALPGGPGSGGTFPNFGNPGGPGANGGGIYNIGMLEMTACTVSNNTGGPGGPGAGGGLGSSTTAGGPGGSCGGLYNTGMAILAGSTFSGNTGGPGGHGGSVIIGGFVVTSSPDGPGGNCGAIYNTSIASLTDCTLDGNSAGSGNPSGICGAIYNTGAMTIVASTVTRNSGSQGGGIYNLFELTADNSLFAGNTASNYSDYYGPFSSQGHNLIGNNDGSFGFFVGKNGDIVGTTNSVIDPLIGPLADNGGPTLTVALQPGSPALDAGDDTILGMVLLDQRGKPRQFGAHVDIGAYELLSPGSMRLTSVSSNGTFGFSFTNTPGVVFTVLSSTNLSLPLSNWIEIGVPMEIAPGQFQFLDAAQSNSPQKFYQVRWP